MSTPLERVKNRVLALYERARATEGFHELPLDKRTAIVARMKALRHVLDIIQDEVQDGGTT